MVIVIMFGKRRHNTYFQSFGHLLFWGIMSQLPGIASDEPGFSDKRRFHESNGGSRESNAGSRDSNAGTRKSSAGIRESYVGADLAKELNLRKSEETLHNSINFYGSL